MNRLIKALIFNNELTVTIIDNTELVNKAIKIHKFTPVCAAAFGRTITACTFMGGALKHVDDKLSVTIKGDGPCGKITVCGNGKLQMRGYMDNPQVDIPLKPNGKLDVSGAVGTNGRITVIRSMGLKNQYSGSSQLVSGEIAEDFTSYYAISEQQPTAMALGVRIGKDLKCLSAGGIIIQALPFASEESLLKAEKLMQEFSSVSTLLESLGVEGILKEYFGTTEFVEETPEYKCLCNRNYLKRVISTIGKKEFDDIINERGEVSVRCEFCGKNYKFTKEDGEKIFGKR